MLEAVAEHVERKNEAVAAENRIIAEEQNRQREERRVLLAAGCAAIRQTPSLRQEAWWKDYGRMCELMNEQLFFLPGKLKSRGISSEKEVRLCVLIVAGYSYKDAGDILALAENSIGIYKTRIAKRLGTTVKNLNDYLVDLAVNAPEMQD